MCDKLFKHVGEFRKHSTAVAKHIIDQMYTPGLHIFEPLSDKEVLEKHKIFLDEEDDYLYFPCPGKRQLLTGKADHGIKNIYSIENVLYKITNKDELLKTANQNKVMEKWKLFGR